MAKSSNNQKFKPLEITLNNNTFIGCTPVNGGLFVMKGYTSIKASKNIFWTEMATKYPSIIGVTTDVAATFIKDPSEVGYGSPLE